MDAKSGDKALVRSLAGAISSGGTTGWPVPRATDPDAWVLPAGRAPQSPGIPGTCSSLLHPGVSASWGAPRRQAARGLHATWTHQSSRAAVLKWAFGHIWRRFRS